MVQKTMAMLGVTITQILGVVLIAMSIRHVGRSTLLRDVAFLRKSASMITLNHHLNATSVNEHPVSKKLCRILHQVPDVSICAADPALLTTDMRGPAMPCGNHCVDGLMRRAATVVTCVESPVEGGTGQREPAFCNVVPSLLEDEGLVVPELATNGSMGGTGRRVPTLGIDVNFTCCMESTPPPALVTQRLDLWKVELSSDFDKTFLLTGLEYGFMIIDKECTLLNSCRSNYKSVLLDDRVKVEVQLRKEIELGRYVVVKKPPSVISSLGAVAKPGGKIRVIHDLSRPDGGVNRFGTDSSVTYSTIEEAISFMAPNCFMAKIDLSEAYRSIPINPQCFNLTGMQWQFSGDLAVTYLYDARLPFGSSLSCNVFQSISSSVIRMLR